MPKWQDEYQHEREWRKADPARLATPFPKPDESLAKAMQDYLEGRDLSYHRARVLGGWYPAYHRGPRIIIPCLRSDGGIWWQARLIETVHIPQEEWRFPPKRWDGASGYKHDAVSYMAMDSKKPVVVVEGPMDGLAAAGCGYPALALLGVKPPPMVFDNAARLIGLAYLKHPAIIIPDMDRLATWQLIQQELGQRGVNGSLHVIPGGYKDLAEMPNKLRQEFLDGLRQ